jgi:pyruvate dehydrogenase E1 component beta subunit
MAILNLVQAINQGLQQALAEDDRVLVFGEDVAANGGVFRVTEGLHEQFGETRVFDTPLAESGIVGLAIGLSAYGLRPVAEIQFLGFAYSAIEQIYTHAARIRTRSRGRFSCPLVIRTPYGGGVKAPELHEESSESFFCHMPGIKVVVPSTPGNAKGLLLAAIQDPDPVIYLEPTRLYRLIKEEVADETYLTPLGKARIAQAGDQLTIIAWGSMLERSLRAARNYPAEVIDLLTLSPFDRETVLASVQKTGRLLIVQEAPKTGGFGAELAATVAEEGIMSLKAPIMRVTGYDVIPPLPLLEDYNLPSEERIISAIEELLRY